MTDLKTFNTAFREQAAEAIVAWNKDYPENPISVGQNWSGLSEAMHGTFMFEYLLPKVGRTDLYQVKIQDRFIRYTKMLLNMAQFNEEYTMTDIVPTMLREDADVMTNFKTNFPKMRTKFYNEGQVYQYRYSINPKDRLKFSSIGDCLRAQQAIYDNVISSFNMYNEDAKKAAIIDYAMRSVKDTTKVENADDLVQLILLKYLNLQSKSHHHNEADLAAGDANTRKTTVSNGEDLLIITTDEIKLFILNSVIANTFQVAGIDITNQISSFEDLGGNYELKEAVTITSDKTKTAFEAMGFMFDRPSVTFPKGSKFNWDITQLEEFEGKYREIKPQSKYWFAMYDVNAFRFEMNRENGIRIQDDSINGWSGVVNVTVSMMTNNNISPFANKCVGYSDDADVEGNLYHMYAQANQRQAQMYEEGTVGKPSLSIQEFMVTL
nr:MAG TPA: Major capsid protein [Caudoviricetes sp.]